MNSPLCGEPSDTSFDQETDKLTYSEDEDPEKLSHHEGRY
jgi:hypothetical protein